jgi:hypothetical protein
MASILITSDYDALEAALEWAALPQSISQKAKDALAKARGEE